MLVLTVKEGRKVFIGQDIVIQVLRDCNGRVRLGIEAPKDVAIVREELLAKEKS